MKKFLCLILLASAPVQADSFGFNYNCLPNGPSWYKTIIEGAKNTFNTTFSPANVLGITAVCGVIGSIAATISKRKKESELKKIYNYEFLIAHNVMDTLTSKFLPMMVKKPFSLNDMLNDDIFNSELIKSMIAHECTKEFPAYYEIFAEKMADPYISDPTDPVVIEAERKLIEPWAEAIRDYYTRSIDHALHTKKAICQSATDSDTILLMNNEIAYLEAQRKALDTINFYEIAFHMSDDIAHQVHDHYLKLYNTSTTNTIVVASLILPIISAYCGLFAWFNNQDNAFDAKMAAFWIKNELFTQQHRN